MVELIVRWGNSVILIGIVGFIYQRWFGQKNQITPTKLGSKCNHFIGWLLNGKKECGVG